jgi:hypothetical protein
MNTRKKRQTTVYVSDVIDVFLALESARKQTSKSEIIEEAIKEVYAKDLQELINSGLLASKSDSSKNIQLLESRS